jgi:hypothetical protein
MKNFKLLLILFSLLSISTFSQKKELKSVEKALKANDFTTAKENLSNISSTYDLESLDKKIKIKYHYLRGMSYYANGESDLSDSYSALDDFNLVIKLEEESSYKTYSEKVNPLKTAMLNKFVENAKGALDIKDYKTSYLNLESAYRVSSRDTLYLYNAALLATENKDFDVALNYYEELDNIGFTGVTTNYYATEVETGIEQSFTSESNRNLFVKAGTHKDERDELTESVQLNVLRSMAAIYKEKENSSKALEYIEKAKLINESDISLILLEANIRWGLGEVENYRLLISKALEIDPTNVDLIYNLGAISNINNDPQAAAVFFERAIALDPKFSKAYLSMGNLILKEQDPIAEKMDGLGYSQADYDKYDELAIELESVQRRALEYFLAVFEFEPNNIEAVKNLKNVYGALGDEENFKLMEEIVKKLEN